MFLIEAILKKHLSPPEQYHYGFASLEGLLPEKYKDFPYGISFLRKLDDRIVDRIKTGPTIDYLEHYLEINRILIKVTEGIARDLEEEGIRAIPIKPTLFFNSREFDQALPDLRYEVSQKMIATRAGLGWIGKTDLFVSKKFGTRLRLGSILIDKEVTPEWKPIDRSRCGKCDLCIKACPAQAATGQSWDIYTDRDVFFNAFKCREQCSKFGKLLGVDKRICGICVAVCPIGRVISPH